MADYRLRAQIWIDLIMRIGFVLDLVFNEEMRIAGFSAIVIDCTNPNQQTICTYGFCSLLGQICHLKRMLVAAGCISEH
jgi:hypothetical protein